MTECALTVTYAASKQLTGQELWSFWMYINVVRRQVDEASRHILIESIITVLQEKVT